MANKYYDSLPIDIVIPWVDGNDPAWQECRKQNLSGSTNELDEKKFRDWDLLRYLFRGIEKNMPWVRTIHFITWGHIPSWLNTANPKLHIVNHKDYIPAEYLPTFSSHTIELNVHRIEGLSEHFIYFNDDTYVLAPCRKKDFFVNGRPCDYAIMNSRSVKRGDDFWIPFIDDSIINYHFNKSEVIKSHYSKWFNVHYGIYNFVNLFFTKWSTFTGFVDCHLPIAFNKSQISKIWDIEPELLDNVCRHHFRNNMDVNIWLARYYRNCEGDFIPKKCDKLDSTLLCDDSNPKALYHMCEIIKNVKRKMICINDGDIADYLTWRNKLAEAFNVNFSEKSSFER